MRSLEDGTLFLGKASPSDRRLKDRDRAMSEQCIGACDGESASSYLRKVASRWFWLHLMAILSRTLRNPDVPMMGGSQLVRGLTRRRSECEGAPSHTAKAPL